MNELIENRLQIETLVNGWIYRDQGDWDRLRELFHHDGTISITWFEGKFRDFVDASQKMGASDLSTKHLLGSPILSFRGNKALAITNAVVICDNARLDVGCTAHCRFYDRLERREGTWKIADRTSIYDMGGFMFPSGPVGLDVATINKYPRQYTALAYLLMKSGFPISRTFPVKGSDQEREIINSAHLWLEQ